jgi:hypothetical protein
MGKTRYPNGKPCMCGCGQSAAKNVVKGINKGWLKYAKGHQPPPALCDPSIRAKARDTLYARLPIGSRRKTHKSRGRWYWEVKVEGRRYWMLEHRHIMEQRLGRSLLSSEHVHHRDNNGLNNGLHADGKDNLVLLTASEHMKLTHKEQPAKHNFCTCPVCGQKHFRKL